jgi:hypothetical protein
MLPWNLDGVTTPSPQIPPQLASPIAPSTDSTADTKIREFLGDQATHNNYTNALKLLTLLFDDIRLEERQVNGQVIRRIRHHSDLLANSTAVANVATTVSQQNGVSSFRKLGMYSHGVGKLYAALQETNMIMPPPPEKPASDTDWYLILETIEGSEKKCRF